MFYETVLFLCCLEWAVQAVSYHHLNVQPISLAYANGVFGSPDSFPCCGVVILPHGVCLAVTALQRLVDNFEHTDVPVGCIGLVLNDACHPFQKFVSALVLPVNVEAGRWGFLDDAVSVLILD